MNRTLLLLIGLVVACLAGCARERVWTSSFGPEGGVATLDSDGVTLVFEGVAWAQRPGEVAGDRATASLKVAGWGRSTMRLDINGRLLTNAYEDGVNTIAIDRFVVKILDGGRRAQIGNQSFDLSGPKKTIVVHNDGSATVR